MLMPVRIRLFFYTDPDLDRVYPTQNATHSVADPNSDLDPPDPHVLGPSVSGSGAISQRYDVDLAPAIIIHKMEEKHGLLLIVDFFRLFSLNMLQMFLQNVICKIKFLNGLCFLMTS
jgi:hypothetical protein